MLSFFTFDSLVDVAAEIVFPVVDVAAEIVFPKKLLFTKFGFKK